MNKIDVLVFEPEKECYMKDIDNTLEAMQEIVGGYIECVTLTRGLDDGTDLVVICNEEGKLKGLPKNIAIAGDVMRGTIFICKAKGDEFVSL